MQTIKGVKMIYEIVIAADTSIGDYVTATSNITFEQIEKFTPLINAIVEKNKQSRSFRNWVTSKYACSSELVPFEMYSEFGQLVLEFQEFVPFGECGIHTIASIVYYEKPTKIILL